MGLFDLFKKKEEPKKPLSEKSTSSDIEGTDRAPGWESIDAEFERVYPGHQMAKLNFWNLSE